MTLDTNSSVWIFTTWGRPFRLVSPFLDCSSPGTTPVQIECCAAISAVLMKSGDIYAWWVFNDTLGRQYREGMVELDKDESAKAIIPDNEMAIPCQTREINSNPVKFRKLPDLPDLLGTGLSEEERRMETKLIKIAAPRWNLIGLTNKGHVLMLHGLRDKDFNGTWRYVCRSAQTILCSRSNGDIQLPNFSEIDKVKDHPAFHVTTGDDGGEIQPEVELTSDTMFITHVSYIVLISSGPLSKNSQYLDFCVRQLLLCLLILHSPQRTILHHPEDTSNHHTGASEQVCNLCLWQLPLRCSHLLREAPDVGQVFQWSFGSRRPWKASCWIPGRVCKRGATSSSQTL